jgi:hypothetical protein
MVIYFFIYKNAFSQPKAIDRRIYDEAWQFFEQMLAVYPNDCNTGGWAHGVRLLIQELRKGQLPSRAHSAGTRNF